MKFTIVLILIAMSISCSKQPEKKTESVQNAIDSTLLNRDKTIQIIHNDELSSFLENPIDLQKYKATKGKSLSSVTHGAHYLYHPNIKDSIFYRYNAFPADTMWSTLEPVTITVFKYGALKHTWKDSTEVLIELKVLGKDDDLNEANLVGITKAELETKFGTNYLTIDNQMVYSYQNKLLILELENNMVKSYVYSKLRSENISVETIQEITKSNGLLRKKFRRPQGNISQFIDEGYFLLDSVSGDLNLDEYKDVILVLKKNDEEKTSDVVDNPEKRPLLILLGQENGSYELAAKSGTAVYCVNCGGIMGDPFTGIRIYSGSFIIDHYGGSAHRWSRTIRFQFSKYAKQWFLDEDIREFFHANEPEKTTSEVRTKEDDFGWVRFEDFDIYKEE